MQQIISKLRQTSAVLLVAGTVGVMAMPAAAVVAWNDGYGVTPKGSTISWNDGYGFGSASASKHLG